ncbi:Kelch repeat type 1 [Dillenia turbinata]|uniref:Kelch repeat type 1 n=1 Tax=Dillenia turbinata TaxID=194707 RepID=A0AAN8VMI6_9MAGN
MVFRYNLDEQNMKPPGCESLGMDGEQRCIISQLAGSCNVDLGFIPKNWHLFEYVIVARHNDLIKVGGNRLLESEICGSCLDHIGRKRKKSMVVAQSGERDNAGQSDDSFLPGLNDDTALDILAWSCRSNYPELASVNKKFKALIDSGYLYKLRRRLGVMEHWVYVACNLMPWEAFDPVSQRWMRLPRMPCDECFTYADKESLAVGTELLVFGRELSGFAIWMYSLISLIWSRCPLMELPRCLFASSSLGEIAIVAGGSDKNGNVLRSAELYNSELGMWQTLPNMNMPRKLCSGFFMDGKFYVIGGISNHMDCLNCGEEYNLETRTWRRIEDMYPGSDAITQLPPAMRSPPLVAVVNNQLYSADQATNEVKKYNKVNNTWSVVKRLPVRADSSSGWGLAFKACGDSLLVIGGHRGPEGEVIVLHSWQPGNRNADKQEWDVLSVREAGAFVHNCAVMGC